MLLSTQGINIPSDKLAKAYMKYELFLGFNRSLIAVMLFYAAQRISFPSIGEPKATDNTVREITT